MNALKSLIEKIKILSNFKKSIIICSLTFISFSILFPAGVFTKTTEVESVAEYAADVAKNHTFGGEYTSLIVEPKNANDTMISTETEFRNLYGSFRESKANYVGTVNANKKNIIKLNDIESNTNYSFMYVQLAGFRNVKYKDAWKHEYYPIQLMFEGDHNNHGCYSFFYISQSDADKILEAKGLDKTIDNYKSLLGTKLSLSFDGVDYDWSIANIYLETNYFFEAVHEVIGDFFLGYNKYPDGFKKQSLYFLRNYPFQNKYYMEYAIRLYSFNKYNYEFGSFNFRDGFIVNNSILNRLNSSKNEILSYFFVIVSILMALTVLILIMFIDFKFEIKNISFVVASTIIPYIIFKIIYVVSHNIYLFSSFSTSLNVWMTLIFVITFVFLSLLAHGGRKNAID